LLPNIWFLLLSSTVAETTLHQNLALYQLYLVYTWSAAGFFDV
jgi:hypothetical protein